MTGPVRIRRRRAAVSAMAFSCALAALTLNAGAVHADAPRKVAWWNEAQQVPAPGATVPAPPTSTDGGITVINSVDGPAAWGAVAYAVGDITSATLKLSSSTPIVLPPGDGLIGCAVDSPGWQAGGNQPWAARPAINPLCALGTLDTTMMNVTFKLAPGFVDSDGAVDVAVLPTGQVPFTINFVAPDAQSLTATAAPSVATGPTVDTPVVDPPVNLVDGYALFPDTNSFMFSTPAPRPAVPRAAVAITTIGGVPAPVAATQRPIKERVAVVVIVLGLLGSLWVLAGQDVRAPRLLGSLGNATASEIIAATAAEAGDTKISGIGRFARSRSTRANRL